MAKKGILILSKLKVSGRNKYRLLPRELTSNKSLENARARGYRVTGRAEIPDSLFQREYATPEAARAAAEQEGYTVVSYQKLAAKMMSYPNPVYEDIVCSIIEDFDELGWIPVTINKDYYLLDGQHRLEAARRMGLEFIDAVIEDTELLTATPAEKAKKPKHRRSVLDARPASLMLKGKKVVL